MTTPMVEAGTTKPLTKEARLYMGTARGTCTHTLDDGRYHRKEEGKTRSDAVTMWVVGTIGETEPSKENPIGHNLRH